MHRTPKLIAATLCGSALALGGCSGVGLQSAEQARAQAYNALQYKARADCRQRSSPSEASACMRETDTSHDTYERSRERLQNPAPAPVAPSSTP